MAISIAGDITKPRRKNYDSIDDKTINVFGKKIENKNSAGFAPDGVSFQ
ncbi:hypothetical protein GX645_01475 [Candidatus Sumerlaeota bacterium]|nr:hypothetical protein [Candidatus Sumerlaeota bacterium]